MKALVTGAAGFIGSSLSKRLIADGHTVIGVDSFNDYYSAELKKANLQPLDSSGEFELLQTDLSEAPLDDILQGVDFVFHQAGQPGVRKSWGQDFEGYIKNNIHATQRLLEAARSSKDLKKFVYASSSSIYGNAEKYPTTEMDLPAPRSPYGVTKLAAENLCSLYADNFDVPTVSLRYFTVYGPGQRPDMAFTRFTQAAWKGSPISIYGDGNQIRDFTYIDDVVQANVLAATGETDPGDVFNVAGGDSVTVNEAITIIESASGRKLNVRYTGAVDGDVYRTGGDISRIQSKLGWSPQVRITEGLKSHVEWAREVLR